LLRHLARCRKDLGTFELELRLQSAGGLERWFRLRGRMLRPTAAGGLHCVGALADVHDRRSADEALDRLSALLAESQAQAHVGGWELDLQTGALSWTEETYRIHELSPYAQLPTVERAIEFYAESSRPVVRAAVAAAIATGTPFAHELELVTAKGRRLWVMATGRAVREHGAVVRLVGAFQDITAQQAADAELRAAKAAAEASSRAKSAFLAAMSHEIRTPMHGVLGYAELLRDSVLTDEQRDHVEIIARSGTALLRLIDDILDSSKVEAGKLVLERTPVDLRSVAGDVMRLLQAHAVEQGLRLSLHAEADGSTWVLADAARIRQVMLNLVGNAVKFTAQGEVRIGIVRQGAQVRCEVVDTGIGIAPADQARLFGEFEQVEDANCRRLGGTGLGLAISRRLIEAMGGRIGMCSEPGLGSTFWFALPATAATAKSAGAVPPGPAPGLVQRARVLVAEDNVVNQRLVRAMLSRLGIEVDLAADGAEAIALATSRPYDLVLMDCLMPGTDGLAATRAIRGQERVHGGQVPIVALTANALAEDRAACLAAGMDDFVSKPFTKPVLLASLHKWLPVGRARACATPSPRAGA
jgi:signal transduction histidine kinase/ActR/RegA family two-component response regulator